MKKITDSNSQDESLDRIRNMVEYWKSISDEKISKWSQYTSLSDTKEIVDERQWLMDNHLGGFVYPWPGVNYYCEGKPVVGPLAHDTKIVKLEYHPLDDEKKQFTLAEFIETAKAELDRYQLEFENSNEYHTKTHTWDEWYSTFHRYMSW